MSKFVAKIILSVEAIDQNEAHEALAEMLNRTQAWEYIPYEGATQPLIVAEPSLDELFDAAVADL